MDSILRRIDEVLKNCMKSIHRWVDVVQKLAISKADNENYQLFC